MCVSVIRWFVGWLVPSKTDEQCLMTLTTSYFIENPQMYATRMLNMQAPKCMQCHANKQQTCHHATPPHQIEHFILTDQST